MTSDLDAEFRSQYGRMPEFRYFSPGRINLIGEHTDYNDGLVMPVAVHLGTTFVAARNADGIIRVYSTLMRERVEIALDDSTSLAPAGGWQDYFAGIVAEFLKLPCVRTGLDIVVDSSVPVGSGLSSSASIGAGMAAILNDEWQAGLSRLDIASLAKRSENDFVGLACGILDQFAVAMSKRGHAIVLDCGTLDWRAIPFPDDKLAILAVESGVPRKLVESGYNQRRAECERALELVNSERSVTSLSELDEADLATLQQLSADAVSSRRARHVVTENARVRAAAEALQKSDLAGLRRAMYESHRSLSEDYEVSCPELDCIVALTETMPGVIGAKMTGAGFGGSVVVLVDKTGVDDVCSTLAESYQLASGREASISVCHLSGGVERIV